MLTGVFPTLINVPNHVRLLVRRNRHLKNRGVPGNKHVKRILYNDLRHRHYLVSNRPYAEQALIDQRLINCGIVDDLDCCSKHLERRHIALN